VGIMISVGKWGGLYVSFKGWSKRICLGFVAITLFPTDGDEIIKLAALASEAIARTEGS